MLASTGGDVPKATRMLKDTPGVSDLQFSKFQAAGPHTAPVLTSRIQLEHMPGYKLFPEAEGSRVLSSSGRMYEKITRQNVFKLADPGQLKQPLTKTQSAADLPALARDVKGSTQSLFASPETYKKSLWEAVMRKQTHDLASSFSKTSMGAGEKAAKRDQTAQGR